MTKTMKETTAISFKYNLIFLAKLSISELLFNSVKKTEEIELLEIKLLIKSGIKKTSKIISEEELAPKNMTKHSSLKYPNTRPPKIPADNEKTFL